MDSMINVHREGILNVCDWANAWYKVREFFASSEILCEWSPPRANEPRRASTLVPSQSNITNVNLILKFFIINTYLYIPLLGSIFIQCNNSLYTP